MSESHFAKMTRQGIEGQIKDGFAANDINAVNYQLDQYPTGRKRPDISNDQMAELLEGRPSQRFFANLGDAGLQDTIEMEAIRLEDVA